MSKIKLFLFPILALLSFSACSGEKTIHWKQEVQLLDGRVIVMERISERTGTVFPENVSLEKSQHIEFVNPDTTKKIKWDVPKGLKPYTLDFENSVPYLVLNAYTVADYNNWNCPNPPYLVYRYEKDNWVPIPFEQLPSKFTKRNLVDMSKSYERFSNSGLMTLGDQEKFIKDLPKDRRGINREKIHPVAEGCHTDVLVRQGRQSEINVKYKE